VRLRVMTMALCSNAMVAIRRSILRMLRTCY
jgi:hypothetical protein